jgi:major vault protein
MPSAEIEVLDLRKGTILTDMSALHVKAIKNFTDIYGKQRKSGDEWLIDK